jgi:EAL domain-containing protein (putative c-di-GMP-specific phosphodiesterase class I)
MQRIVQQALALVKAAEGSAVELLVNGELCYVCAAGSLADFVGLRLDPSASLSGLAVQTGRTQRCDDSEVDPRVDREACRRTRSTSMVCVPLRRAEEPVGVLKIAATTSHAFSDRDVATMSKLARFVTTTITMAHELSAAAEELCKGVGNLGSARVDDQAMSAFVANVIYPDVSDDLEIEGRVQRVLDGGGLDVVLQPIVELKSGSLAGAEALARFPGNPWRPPEVWFAEARRAKRGLELQLVAVRRALRVADVLPEHAFLAVNVDAEALMSEGLAKLLEQASRPVVLELTEHVEVSDYPGLRRVLRRLRAEGARLAIDDTGAGYSSLAHIVRLAPELIKLDIDLVRGIDLDPVRRSLVSAVATFAAETRAKVVAEGIETQAELEALRLLPVDYGQGYLLGRPMPGAHMRAWEQRRKAKA